MAGETQELLQEHDDLWQLDATQREQLAWLWLHKKFESIFAQLSDRCECYERYERYERLCHLPRSPPRPLHLM